MTCTGTCPPLRIDLLLGDLPLQVRPIGARDREHLIAGMERLSDRSRYLRFFTPTRELTDEQLRYFTEPDGLNHVALIALTPDVESGGARGDRIVGTVRFVRRSDDPTTAELAIVVGDSFQGRGIGTLLLRILAGVARDCGVRRFTALVLPDNQPMLALLRRLGAEVSFDAAAGATAATLDTARVPAVT